MSLTERALGRLPHHGEGLGQQRVEGLAVRDAFLEARGVGAQLVVGETRESGLEPVDGVDRREQALVSRSFWSRRSSSAVLHGRGLPGGGSRRR
jgi:hypothetical protein